MLVLIAFAALISTLIGGLFALALKDRLHLILGFSAGAIIGVTFFDLLPEALELGGDASHLLSLTALGFCLYLILDRFLFTNNQIKHSHRGEAGALSLSIHSFLDGVGIGLAFKVSPEVGFIVTAAVLTHDFSDGINTVSMILKSGGARKKHTVGFY